MKEHAFITTSFRDVKLAKACAAKGHLVVAGTARTHSLLRETGIDPARADTLVSEHEAQNILEQTDQLTCRLQQRTQDRAMPPGLQAIMLADLTRVLFRYLGLKAIESATGRTLWIASRSSSPAGSSHPLAHIKEIPVTNVSYPGEKAAWGLRFPIHLWKAPPGAALDFQTPSGKKISDDEHASFVLRARQSRLRGLDHLAHNALEAGRAIFSSKQPTFRYSVSRVTGLSWCDNRMNLPASLEQFGDDIRGIVARTLRETEAIHSSYHDSVRRLLPVASRVSTAKFNHVGTSAIAGIITALHESGIKTSLKSHGALVPHGSGARERVVTHLSNCVNNSFPDIAELLPRSPLQAEAANPGQTITQRSRLHQPNSANHDPLRPFRVYYAPNCFGWIDGYHGVSISCFETLRCMEYLAQRVTQMPSTELFLRIKTTASDMANKGEKPPERAVAPGDVAHLFSPQAGVIDACHGSHSEYLSRADLVVSEGVTAVMFESLEHRKPLLLLNESRLRPPSLPAVTLEQLRAGAARSPVYAGYCDSSLPKLLTLIGERHRDAPLRDDELRDYIWV